MSVEIKKIGVIGAGQMGLGIAHVCAVAGYDVHMVDVSDEVLSKAIAKIERNLTRQVARKKLDDASKTEAINRITIASDYSGFGDIDLVIEAATENEDVKNEIYSEVCPVLKKDAILTTNTSSLSITRLAAQTDRPGRFMGIHFMNPAPMMELIELIRGITTEAEIFDIVTAFTRTLNKTPVSAEDYPAFIVNRILMPMINEAVYTLYEGVGGVIAIDTAMKLGAHHPMGPLELADFIGLDTCLAVMQVLHEGLADPKYRPCPLLTKYVEAGWLGRKTDRGFYDYTGDEPQPTR